MLSLNDLGSLVERTVVDKEFVGNLEIAQLVQHHWTSNLNQIPVFLRPAIYLAPAGHILFEFTLTHADFPIHLLRSFHNVRNTVPKRCPASLRCSCAHRPCEGFSSLQAFSPYRKLHMYNADAWQHLLSCMDEARFATVTSSRGKSYRLRMTARQF